jgi:hypothetical protein
VTEFAGAPGFERFFAAYPRKKNQAAARRAWRRAVKSEEVESILARLEIFKLGEWKGIAQQHIPYPASWLDDHRWLDEIEAPATHSTNGQTGALHGKPGKYSNVPMTEARNVN